LRDFNIEKMGCVKRFVGVKQPVGYVVSPGVFEQYLDHERGVNHDHRLSRSALTA
jgi:hypothetical protein